MPLKKLPPPVAQPEAMARVKLPEKLLNKKCFLDMGFKTKRYDDALSFRYSLMAHAQADELGLSGEERADGRHIAASPFNENFVVNPIKGRHPRDYKPEFKDVGLDFYMLSTPPTSDEIDTLRRLADLGLAR